jgi:hypothetical protein
MRFAQNKILGTQASCEEGGKIPSAKKLKQEPDVRIKTEPGTIKLETGTMKTETDPASLLTRA